MLVRMGMLNIHPNNTPAQIIQTTIPENQVKRFLVLNGIKSLLSFTLMHTAVPANKHVLLKKQACCYTNQCPVPERNLTDPMKSFFTRMVYGESELIFAWNRFDSSLVSRIKVMIYMKLIPNWSQKRPVWGITLIGRFLLLNLRLKPIQWAEPLNWMNIKNQSFIFVWIGRQHYLCNPYRKGDWLSWLERPDGNREGQQFIRGKINKGD